MGPFIILTMNWITKLFTSRTEQIETLKQEINELKVKLEERQEAINKTNAYYKKKLHETQRKTTR